MLIGPARTYELFDEPPLAIELIVSLLPPRARAVAFFSMAISRGNPSFRRAAYGQLGTGKIRNTPV